MAKTVSINVQIHNGPLQNTTVPIDVEPGVGESDTSFTAAGGATVGLSVVLLAVAAANSWNPAGPIIAGLVGLGLLAGKIVQAVRDANTMTVSFINAVPQSTLQLTDFQPTAGELVNGSKETLLNDKAPADCHTGAALQFYFQPHRDASNPSTVGLQSGQLTGKITMQNGQQSTFAFSWYNPLSRDNKFTKASYTFTPQQNSGLIDFKKDVSHPNLGKGGNLTNYRADMVTIIIFPQGDGLKSFNC